MTNIVLNNVQNLQDTTTAKNVINNNSTAIVTAVEASVAKAGDIMSGTLDMNSNRLLNIPAPATAEEPLRLADLNSFVGGGTVSNIPSGGTANQVLTKNSSTNYDISWENPESISIVAGTGINLTGNVINVANTAVTAGNYGSPTQSPNIVINAQGQITSANNSSIAVPASAITSGTLSNSLMPAFTGDVTSTAGSTNTTVGQINGIPLGTTTATAGNILIGSGTNWVSKSVTGDANINSAGTLSINNNAVTNAKLNNTAAYTLKGNNTASSSTPSDFTIDSLTLKTSPTTSDEILIWDVAGAAMKKSSIGTLPSSAGVSAINSQTGALTVTANGGDSVSSSAGVITLSSPGGFRNKFRNAHMNVASRGTSGTVTTGNTNYTLDGWMVSATGASAVWQQQANNSVAGNALRILCATGLTACTVQQRIESFISASIRGNGSAPVCTVQFSIYNNTGATIVPQIASDYPVAIDNWTSSTNDLAVTNLQSIPNASRVTVAYSFTPSNNILNGYQFRLLFGGALNVASGYVEISCADFRITPGVSTGLNSNPPFPELMPIPLENIMCQRYLPAWLNLNTNFTTGQAVSTSSVVFTLQYFAIPRVVPTGLVSSSASNFKALTAGGSLTAFSSLVFNSASLTALQPQGTGASGLVAGNASQIYGSSSSDFIYAIGAEL